MLGYRLFILNDAGHIVDAMEVELLSDGDALHWAEQHRGVADLELWSGGCVVGKLPQRQDA